MQQDEVSVVERQWLCHDSSIEFEYPMLEPGYSHCMEQWRGRDFQARNVSIFWKKNWKFKQREPSSDRYGTTKRCYQSTVLRINGATTHILWVFGLSPRLFPVSPIPNVVSSGSRSPVASPATRSQWSAHAILTKCGFLSLPLFIPDDASTMHRSNSIFRTMLGFNFRTI